MLPDGWGACDTCGDKPVGITAGAVGGTGPFRSRAFRCGAFRCDDDGGFHVVVVPDPEVA